MEHLRVLKNSLTLYILGVTNINFLQQISIYTQEKRLWELIKWSIKKMCFDLLTSSLNLFYGKCMEVGLENLHVDIWGLKC